MEIPSYFRRYLTAIQPTRASRERTIQLHQTLTERLSKDKPFQEWYDGTFLYGSYRRNTAVQPIKDVDVCVLLKIDRNDYTPEAVVRFLRTVLDRNGYKDKTALQRRSVRIDMSGTTLDVVPVVAAGSDDQPLWIPDRPLKEWVKTHPKGHIAEATRLNKEGGKRYIPFVKIVKAWYRYQLRDVERPKPKGFTLEALVAHYQDADAPSYAEAFVNFLTNLDEDCGDGLARGIFPEVPDPGLTGEVVKVSFTADEAKRFGEVVRTSLNDAKAALEVEGIKASAAAWNSIFGPKFPTVPTTMTERAAQEAADQDEEDGTLDEEIAEVELPTLRQLGQLKIQAHLSTSQNGFFRERYPSGGRSLPKNMWLRFSIVSTDVAQPYVIRWIVTNHGHEAQLAGDMGHTAVGGRERVEHSMYRGSHTMTCELRRDGVLLAQAKHIVNIRKNFMGRS
jgi:hypothetical protein